MPSSNEEEAADLVVTAGSGNTTMGLEQKGTQETVEESSHADDNDNDSVWSVEAQDHEPKKEEDDEVHVSDSEPSIQDSKENEENEEDDDFDKLWNDEEPKDPSEKSKMEEEEEEVAVDPPIPSSETGLTEEKTKENEAVQPIEEENNEDECPKSEDLPTEASPAKEGESTDDPNVTPNSATLDDKMTEQYGNSLQDDHQDSVEDDDVSTKDHKELAISEDLREFLEQSATFLQESIPQDLEPSDKLKHASSHPSFASNPSVESLQDELAHVTGMKNELENETDSEKDASEYESEKGNVNDNGGVSAPTPEALYEPDASSTTPENQEESTPTSTKGNNDMDVPKTASDKVDIPVASTNNDAESNNNGTLPDEDQPSSTARSEPDDADNTAAESNPDSAKNPEEDTCVVHESSQADVDADADGDFERACESESPEVVSASSIKEMQEEKPDTSLVAEANDGKDADSSADTSVGDTPDAHVDVGRDGAESSNITSAFSSAAKNGCDDDNSDDSSLDKDDDEDAKPEHADWKERAAASISSFRVETEKEQGDAPPVCLAPDKETSMKLVNDSSLAVSAAVAMWDTKKVAPSFSTPASKSFASNDKDNKQTSNTDATEASTVATLTPSQPDQSSITPKNLRDQFGPKTPFESATKPKNLAVSFTPNTESASSKPSKADESTTADKVTSDGEGTEEPPENEFQKVQLRKSSVRVEKYIQESRLEFAEMIAGALKNKNNNSPERGANLEVLRHMDALKQQVALLQDDDPSLWQINRLKKELLDMFSRGSAIEEAYLMQWILPMHRERDPKTGQWVMCADHVALLQSATTSDEMTMISGLGVVRSVLQSNFKAINGLHCLQIINDYACLRFGKKRRAPQTPWALLAELFEKAEIDDSTEDIHQRVCNALVQWVVREILGTTQDDVTSKNCFHAIFLVASLKLELQRLAPLALEQGPTVEVIDSQSAAEGQQKRSVRAPIVEKLLRSEAWSGGASAATAEPPAYKNTDTIAVKLITSTEAREDAGANDPPLTSAEESQSADHKTEGERISAAVASYDPTKVDRDQAMKEALAVRDSSRKLVVSGKEEDQRPLESELPKEVQDSHRVIRTILGPNHKYINVSDCFEAMRVYAELIVNWQEASEQNQKLLEGNSTSTSQKPSLEEETLRVLERKICPDSPPKDSAVQKEGSKGDEANPEGEASGPSEPEQLDGSGAEEKDRKVTGPLVGEISEEKDTTVLEPPADVNRLQNQQISEPGEEHISKPSSSTPVPQPPGETTAGTRGDSESPKEIAKVSTPTRSQVAAATKIQGKTRSTFFDKLKHLKVKGKEHEISESDPRHPKKRRSRWNKFFGQQ